MNASDHVLMSKELVDILGIKSEHSSVLNDRNKSVFDRVVFTVDRETYECSISEIILSDYELVIKAIANESVCLSLLNHAIEKKIKVLEIIKNDIEFIVTTVSINRGGNFTLTAAVTNI